MAIASVIAASIRNNNRQNYSPNASKPDEKISSPVNEASLSTQWLRQFPTGLLNHINAPLLKEIDSKIKKISKKELREPELKKSYQTLIQCVSNYQIEAEAIYSAKKNIKTNILLFTLAFFGLALIFCIPISIFYLPIFPITLLLTLVLASLVSIHNSNSGLHSKHPANEIELKMHFKNFMHTLESYKNKSENNSEANFQPSSKNTLPHSDYTSLNCNASLFKLVNPQHPQEEQGHIQHTQLKPQQLL